LRRERQQAKAERRAQRKEEAAKTGESEPVDEESVEQGDVDQA
jgi:hypothetical protein